MKPAFRIEADGADITGAIENRLISLQVTDAAGVENDNLSIEIEDGPPLINIPLIGASMVIYLGYGVQPGAENPFGGLRRMGTFVLDEVEISGFPRKMRLKAHAVDMAGQFKTQKTRSFDNTTLEEIVTTIAGESGFILAFHPSLSGITIQHKDQRNQSNAAFVTELASEFDAVASVKEGRLYFGPRGSSTSITGQALPTVSIDLENCINFRFGLQSKSKVDGVKAKVVNRKTATYDEVLEGDEGVVATLPDPFPTTEEATRAAKSARERLGREEETFGCTVIGNPNTRAELKAVLVGFRPGIRTDWLISRVVHMFNAAGYNTQITCEVPDVVAAKTAQKGRQTNTAPVGGTSEYKPVIETIKDDLDNARELDGVGP